MSLKARPLRSILGAVQARAWLIRGAVHSAALRAPSRAAIPVVFALHNFAYHDAGFFRPVDAVLVPLSDFDEPLFGVIDAA